MFNQKLNINENLGLASTIDKKYFEIFCICVQVFRLLLLVLQYKNIIMTDYSGECIILVQYTHSKLQSPVLGEQAILIRFF